MNTHEIKLKIHEEADLFTPYDPDQMMLSEDISDYLVRNYENKHRKAIEKYIVHIYSDLPVDEEHVREAIRQHCRQEEDNIRHDIRLETNKEIILFIIGTAILILWFILSLSREGVGLEILSIMGWVAVWEGTSIIIMRRPELYIQSKIYEYASQAEIIIDIPGDDGSDS